MLDPEVIRAAAQRLAGRVHRTPLERQATFSARVGVPVYLKLENLQKTGSFKLRGALNKILQLSPEQRQAGVVAASAGNHAQGVAYAARELGVRALIVMPQGAPTSKVAATREYGAEVVLAGESYDEAFEVALELANRRGLHLIHAFDDEAVMAGQGTVALEILDELPDVATVVVPVGGGGLMAGMAVALKAERPEIRLVGVQAEGADAVVQALARPLQPPSPPPAPGTIADGIAVKRPGRLTLPILAQYVDELVTVSDDEIASTILTFMERMKLVVEGAGAAAVAALLARKATVRGPAVAVVSGGNIDVDMIARIIERGLVRTGRRLRLLIRLADRPGALHRLTGVVAAGHGNILGIEHDRTNVQAPIGTTEVTLWVAVRDEGHGEELVARLRAAGYQVKHL